MFSRIGQTIYENEAVAKTSDFTVGLEIEMQRIDGSGQLSQEPYSAGIDDEQTNPWITNDFFGNHVGNRDPVGQAFLGRHPLLVPAE